jgi:hypothetical protein
MLIFLCIFIGSILYYKHKGKKTIQDKQDIYINNKNNILNKINKVQMENEQKRHSLITNLPVFEDEHYTNLTNHNIVTNT